MNGLKALMNADVDTLKTIDGIGSAMAQSIYDYFHNPKNRAEIEELLALGLRPSMPQPRLVLSKLLSRKENTNGNKHIR